MLLELRIRDFAVIHDLTVRVRPGLNALTGETGAGKSIIVGALSLLLGERASSEAVRSGADTALIEAVFELPGGDRVAERLVELGIPLEDDLVVLRREVALEGRNRAWINGSPTTVGVLREVGSSLVDIHGQHEHQTLLQPAEQRALLDAYAGVTPKAGAVRDLHGRLAEARGRLARAGERMRELEGRADFLRFQVQEIESASLEPDEDTALGAEVRRLEHSEELIRESERLHGALYDGEDSVTDRTAELRDGLRRLARIDPSLAGLGDSLDEAHHGLVDIGRRLGDYARRLEHDPERLEELRQRLDVLFRLKRKYGPELPDVIATGERLAAELAELDRGARDLGSLEKEITRLEGELRSEARALGEARREAASRLEDAVRTALPDLGMPGGEFRIELEPLPEPGPGGGERVSFLVSLNPGFEPRALSRIASGGELSRVMLAIKSALARVDRIPTLIFDEIDAGIGGIVASGVAGKLQEVAAHHQVFVVTHLAQLASRAQHHLRVEKGEEEGLAAARVTELEGEERIREIARMLGGDPESSTSREHARELLQTV